MNNLTGGARERTRSRWGLNPRERHPIWRADLVTAVYYRVCVGPFTSAGDADQFCSGLKAAGGQCIVLAAGALF
jgi:hypothetical protein